MPSLGPPSQILTSTDPPISWLIPELLPRSYFVTLIAESGIGKSTLSYAISLAIATQTPILGRTPVRPQNVLYFDQENSEPDCKEYLRQAWYGLGRPSLPLIDKHLAIEHMSLGGRDWTQKALAAVQRHQPALIVFDTAVSCAPPQTQKGEDDNAEAAKAITFIRFLQSSVQPVPASALVLKHALTFMQSDKEKGKEPDLRGAKGWRNMADSVLFLMKKAGHPPKDGLHKTRLFALKSRAFGMRQEIHITPSRTDAGKGLRLEVSVPD